MMSVTLQLDRVAVTNSRNSMSPFTPQVEIIARSGAFIVARDGKKIIGR